MALTFEGIRSCISTAIFLLNANASISVLGNACAISSSVEVLAAPASALTRRLRSLSGRPQRWRPVLRWGCALCNS
jgi:hypothetical protein